MVLLLLLRYERFDTSTFDPNGMWAEETYEGANYGWLLPALLGISVEQLPEIARDLTKALEVGRQGSLRDHLTGLGPAVIVKPTAKLLPRTQNSPLLQATFVGLHRLMFDAGQIPL